MLDGHPSRNGSKWRDQADYSDRKKKFPETFDGGYRAMPRPWILSVLRENTE
jgi:hypothetical protein